MTDTDAPAAPVSGRLLSLDVFRGATIAGMILVNNPGDWDPVYWPLLHAHWHGWTPTDLIFPFFLFIVGVSLTLSKRTGWKPALWRALKLIGLGLLLNLYPYFPIAELRWPGVLQRIGVCYLAGWAAKRYLRPSGQALLAVALLAGYFVVMTRVTGPEGHAPGFEMETNLAAQLDRILLVPHVWSVTKTWDPEGLLSTFPAIATTLIGVLFGEWLLGRNTRSAFRTTLGLLLGGLVLTALGVAWAELAPAGLAIPINKGLWTSSYVLFTRGLAAAFLGLSYFVVDVAGLRRWAKPFVSYGRNAIAVYVASGLLADTLSAVRWPAADGTLLSLQQRLYAFFPASVLSPYAASFVWALLFVLLFYLMAAVMERRGIYLKV
jgi:predicted acyltransferase